MRNKHQWLNINNTALLVIFLLSIMLRTPGIKLELSPLAYCDEDLYITQSIKRIHNNSIPVPHFLSGNVNFLIPKYAGKSYLLITNKKQITDNELRLICRFLANVLFTSLGVFFIFCTLYLLTRNRIASLFSSLLYAICPLLTASSTWFYPDGYLYGFSAIILFIAAKIYKKQVNEKKYDYKNVWLYGILGFITALSFSVKYSAVVFLMFPILLLFDVFLKSDNNINYKQLFSLKKPARFKFEIKNLYKIITFTVVGILTFMVVNRDAINHFDLFLQALHIPHYNPSDNPLIGMWYYFSVFFFFSAGIGISVALFVIILRNKMYLYIETIAILSIPLTLILILSRYDQLFARNLYFVVPFGVIIVGIGFNQLTNKIKKITYVTIILSSILPWVLKQFYFDLKVDSRILAHDWLVKINRLDASSNRFCGHPPITLNTSNTLLVLDTWFGNIDNDGKFRPLHQNTFLSVLKARHLRDLHYLNHARPGYINLGSYGTSYVDLEKYHIIKKFEGSGPVVYAYELNK